QCNSPFQSPRGDFRFDIGAQTSIRPDHRQTGVGSSLMNQCKKTHESDRVFLGGQAPPKNKIRSRIGRLSASGGDPPGEVRNDPGSSGLWQDQALLQCRLGIGPYCLHSRRCKTGQPPIEEVSISTVMQEEDAWGGMASEP